MTINFDPTGRFADPQKYIDDLELTLRALIWKYGSIPDGVDKKAERVVVLDSVDFTRGADLGSSVELLEGAHRQRRFRVFDPENDITAALRTGFTSAVTRKVFIPDPATLKRAVKTVFNIDL